jgi:replicative DNA helicase
MDRLPPQSREAERCVLGSMLRDNAVIGDVVQIIRAESFYLDAHQKIFTAITTLYDKGHPVDLVILADFLKEQQHIEDVGGYPYLGELWEVAPTAANAEYYARIVRDKSLVRNLIHAGTEILRDAYDQAQPADELLESAERKILDVAQMGITGQALTLQQAIDEAYDRIDVRTQRGHTSLSGIPTGYIDLDSLTAGFQNSELVILAARPSVGKCLSYDSEIVLSDGSIATIEELYRRRRAKLLTLQDDWRFRLTEPSDFIDDGVKPVYRVTTQSGRWVECTLSHPFRSIHGWKRLENLRLGDHIAVPRRIDVFGRERLRECEVKLLGYLLGDGGLTETVPTFTNGNPHVQSDFTDAVTSFGAVKVREDSSGGTRTSSFYVSGDPQFIATRRATFAERLREAIRERSPSARAVALALGVSPASVCLWGQGACVPKAETFAALCAVLEMTPDELVPEGHAAVSRSSKNPLTLWLKEMGIWGKGAHEKHIPPVVFRLERSQLALFLNRLFATDGWATVLSSGAPQLGYCSVSRRLAQQVCHLLLRFGIHANLRRRLVKYKGGCRQAWQLDVTDQQSIRIFLDEIGIFGKEEALARVERAMAGRRYQTNRDLIPVEIWARLREVKGKESWCSIARRAGLRGHTNIHVGKRSLSRQRLAQFAATLNDQPLQQLAGSEVYWDAIVSIEYAGFKQVYDLTIPETHNFVANDICVHNTAFALNVVRHICVDEHLPVLFVSLEQSRIELAERLLCCQARVDSHKLRKGHLGSDDMERLIKAGDVLRQAKLYIDDSPGQGMLRIAANARRLHKRHEIRLVVIDYLQLIEPDDRRAPRQEQVANISRRLKFLARELQIPVISLAQVNRSSEDRQDHRPRLSDLRESGSLEQDADTVLLLHRPVLHEPGQHEGIVEVIIGKQRNGPTGEVTLTYLKQFMRFENFAVEQPFGYEG